MPTSLFANNLKFLRKMRGLSQQKLAEQLGLKRNNIASYEAGIVEPRALNFLKIALFFDIPPGGLLEEDISASFLDGELQDTSSSAAAGKQLASQLHLFSGHTSDMQKVLEGFREFQRLSSSSPAHSPGAEPGKKRLEANGELDTLLDIMEQLLESNWKLIGTISMEKHGA